MKVAVLITLMVWMEFEMTERVVRLEDAARALGAMRFLALGAALASSAPRLLVRAHSH